MHFMVICHQIQKVRAQDREEEKVLTVLEFHLGQRHPRPAVMQTQLHKYGYGVIGSIPIGRILSRQICQAFEKINSSPLRRRVWNELGLNWCGECCSGVVWVCPWKSPTKTDFNEERQSRFWTNSVRHKDTDRRKVVSVIETKDYALSWWLLRQRSILVATPTDESVGFKRTKKQHKIVRGNDGYFIGFGTTSVYHNIISIAEYSTVQIKLWIPKLQSLTNPATYYGYLTNSLTFLFKEYRLVMKLYVQNYFKGNPSLPQRVVISALFN